MRIALIILILVALVGCDQKDLPQPTETSKPAAPVAPKGLDDLNPPAPRMALPPALRTMRLSDASVGTISDPKTPKRTLHGLGLASCQTGWTFQGLYFNDDGVLVATHPLTVALAEIPVGKAIRYEDPNIPNRALNLEFQEFGYDRIRGQIRVLDTEDNDATILDLTVDGPPTALVRAPGLGPAGCFDTGFWKASHEGSNAFGPVTAVYDPSNLHYVALRLTPTESLVALFTLKVGERGRGDLITTSVEKIKNSPDVIPIRLYLERRSNTSDPGSSTGPQLELEEFPLESGELLASFPTGEVGGPIRIELKNVKLPKWKGPLSGATIESIRAEALFVTDTDGEEVPLPSQPEWFERAPVVLP